MRILADVDTGIDDACALLYLCGRPEVELVGITTSAGNTSARQAALNTLVVLELAGCGEVEVAVGEPAPLVKPLVTTPENAFGSEVVPPGATVTSRLAATGLPSTSWPWHRAQCTLYCLHPS